jgi:hypothetical protein
MSERPGAESWGAKARPGHWHDRNAIGEHAGRLNPLTRIIGPWFPEEPRPEVNYRRGPG